MSAPFEFSPGGVPFGGAPPGYAPAPPPPVRVRHPLGLPAGSVRALLTLMVLGTVWALLLFAPEKMIKVPLYLQYLTFLVIGSYFGSRGSSPRDKAHRESPPLHLPRGSIRFLIIAGFLGVIGYTIYQKPDLMENLDLGDAKGQPWLPVAIFGSFFVGVVLSSMARMALQGPEGMPAWYADVIAWVSIIAVFMLGGGVIYELVIKPTLPDNSFDMRTLTFPWEAILSGVVAFYFGARS